MEFIGEIILAIASIVVSYFFGVKRGARKDQERVIAVLEKYHADTEKNADRYRDLRSRVDSDGRLLERLLSGQAAASSSGAAVPSDEDDKAPKL